MGTERKKVGIVPMQITDGTNNALISVITGEGVEFADSETSPDIDAGDFLKTRLVASAPLKIWVWRRDGLNCEIAVTRW